MVFETVLDEKGLPVVWATRHDDGNVSFYELKRRPGGMLSLQPATDAVTEAVRLDLDGDAGDVPLDVRVLRAQTALAGTLGGEMEAEARTVEEVQEELEEQAGLARAERERALSAEAELERVRAELRQRDEQIERRAAGAAPAEATTSADGSATQDPAPAAARGKRPAARPRARSAA